MPDGTSSGSSATTEVRLPKYTVQVRCTGNHSVAGLFVLFRPKRPTGSAGAARIADVIEDPDEPAGDSVVDGHFFVAIVGRSHVLELVHADGNPWAHFFTDDNPHSLKLSPLQKYEGCLVRHPDPALVRGFAAYLGFGTGADTYETAWASRADAIKDLDVKLDTSNGDQLVLNVSETASDYLPPGAYDGWTLYRDMPHAQCTALIDAVVNLQNDLAKLCFPVGTQEKPYLCETGSKPDQNQGVYDGKVQATVGRFQEHAAAGEAFEITASARGAVGSHRYPALLGGEVSCDVLTRYTLGVCDKLTGEAIQHWAASGLRKPGPILLPISDSIGTIHMLEDGAVATEAWDELVKTFGCSYGLKSGHSFRNVLDKGAGKGKRLNSIHKTGLALDFAGGATAHVRAAFPIRFEAHWMEQTHDIEGQRGKVNRAQRDYDSKNAKVEQAQTELQQAQSQLDADRAQSAADQAASASTQRADDRRVHQSEQRVSRAQAKLDRARTEADHAHQNLETEQNRLHQMENDAQADTRGAKNRWKIRWRLYGHTTLDPFNAPGDLQTLRNDLASYGSRLVDRIARRFGPLSQDAAARTWATEKTGHFAEVANRLMSMTDDELRSRLFRRSVYQWIYNFYEIDGGSRSPQPWPPTHSEADFPPAPFAARAYVNITALGAMCQLARIGGNRVRDTSIDAKGQVHMTQMPMRRAFGTIAQLLLYLKNLPDQRHANDAISVIRAKQKLTPSYHAADLEAAFAKAWFDAFDSVIPRRNNVAGIAADGADLAFTLAVQGKGDEQVQAVLNKIGSFSSNRFLLVAAGTRTGVTAPAIADGPSLKSTLNDAITRFKDEAARKAADAANSGGRRGRNAAPAPSTKKDRDEWRIVVRPVLTSATDPDQVRFAPDDLVELPAASSSNLEDLWRPLEWWHYQHESAAGVSWGSLLEKCGFSAAILGGDDPPETTEARVFPRGVGYAPVNFPDTTGGCTAGEVENEDPSVPEGG